MTAIEEISASEPAFSGMAVALADREMKVLVLEDDPTTRSALDLHLTRSGHEVRTARSVAEAIRAARRFPPDVLLSDWSLEGGETALAAIEWLLDRHPRLPIVVNSALPCEEYALPLRRLRARFVVVPKPAPLREISRALEWSSIRANSSSRRS